MTARFQELLRDVGHDTFGLKRGWQRQLAARWNMYPAEITNILAGKRRVGADLAGRVAKIARLDMRYFTGVGRYTAFVSLGPRGGDRGATRTGQTWDDIQSEARKIEREWQRHELHGLKRAEVLAHDILESRPVRLARELVRAIDEAPGEDVGIAADLVLCVAHDSNWTAEESAAIGAYLLQNPSSDPSDVEPDTNVSP